MVRMDILLDAVAWFSYHGNMASEVQRKAADWSMLYREDEQVLIRIEPKFEN